MMETEISGAHQETGPGRGSARERERLAGRRGSGVHLKFLELLHSVGLLAGRHLAGVVVASLFAPAPCAFDRPWRGAVLKKAKPQSANPRRASPALSKSHQSIETPELLIMKVALAARVALLAAAIYAVAAQPQCPAPVGLAPLTPAVRRPNRVDQLFCSFLSSILSSLTSILFPLPPRSR